MGSCALVPADDSIPLPVLLTFSNDVYFSIILGVFISFILSRRYIKPISAGLDIIKLDNLAEAPKTKILEIDDRSSTSTENEELKNKPAGESCTP